VAQQEYIKWPTDADIPLHLALVGVTGAGATGKIPQVSIRRIKETATGTLLDNYYWNGTDFQLAAYWHDLSEFDAIDNPGVYRYIFEQSLIGTEHQYLMYYRHTTTPIGFAKEIHTITNEVYIPRTNPDPIVIGPQTIMGQLELIKDGGDGDFDETQDSLHDISLDFRRILGLIHDNGIVDNHQYDAGSNLTSARLRVFDSAVNVPTTPGGSETTGLLFEYVFTGEYTGTGLQSLWTGKRIT
jgi:hypothetical protein